MLDLRYPIGYFFLINSALLIIDAVLQQGKHDVVFAGYTLNLDVSWGVIMLLFGALMTALAWNARRSGKG